MTVVGVELLQLGHGRPEPEPEPSLPVVGGTLSEAVGVWMEKSSTSRLGALPASENSLLVVDDRYGWPSRELVLSPGLETEAYPALTKGRTLPALARQLDELGISVIDGRLEALVEEWTTLGPTFREGSTYPAPATGLRW